MSHIVRPNPLRVDPIDMIPVERRSREYRKKRNSTKKKSKSKSKSRSRQKQFGGDRQKSKEKSREKSKSRGKNREKSREKGREKSKSREKSREISREKNREKSREISREKSREKSKSRGKSREKSREKSRGKNKSKSRSRAKPVQILEWTDQVKDSEPPISKFKTPKENRKIVSRVCTDRALLQRLSPYFGKDGMSGSKPKKKGYRVDKFKKLAIKTQTEIKDPDEEINDRDEIKDQITKKSLSPKQKMINQLVQENLQTISGANL